MKERTKFRIFWALMFAAAFLVLSRRGYSDGDDAFFYRYAHEMGFFEYLGWRYQTWVGRMGGEAMVYLTFRLGLPFWRAANALMLVLLPAGILRLAGCAAGQPDAVPCGRAEGTKAPARDPGGEGRSGSAQWKRACAEGDYRVMGLAAAAAAVAGYLLMNFMTLGYAAVWVNGSIFYTWSFTCGIWALVPFAEMVFSGDDVPALRFLYSIPCAVIASMSVEQMGAVLLVFEVLALLCASVRRRRLPLLPAIQAVLTVAAFAALFLAPGNGLRVASEITHWMPEYETMPFGQHLFITAHWMISSFANENRLFLCAIWIAGIALLLQRSKGQGICAADRVCAALAAVFTAAALSAYAGVTLFSDLGMQYVGIASRIEAVPSFAAMDGRRLFVSGWWIAALLFTPVLVWRASGRQATPVLAFLACIASEAIMYFSPTMYASGARVYYLTDLLCLFVILVMSFGIREKAWRNAFYGIVIALGLLNFAFQIGDFMAWM